MTKQPLAPGCCVDSQQCRRRRQSLTANMSKIGYRLRERSMGRSETAHISRFHPNDRAIKWNLSCHFYRMWHPRSSHQKFTLCALCSYTFNVAPLQTNLHNCDVRCHTIAVVSDAFFLFIRRCKSRSDKRRNWREQSEKTTGKQSECTSPSWMTSREMDRIHIHTHWREQHTFKANQKTLLSLHNSLWLRHKNQNQQQ